MCGILGGTSLKIKNEKEIALMLSVLRHRGPDGSGIFLDKKNRVFLGHQRLSIIDLSDRAKQPMRIITNNQSTITKNKQECVITFNGEIYNYKEIKRELEEKGYKFKSDSDTEVVLSSYLEWGTKCVERFRGMFAFGIWDANKKKLVLVRDRFGVKPLYYYFGGSDFIFASELKAICEFSGFYKEINLEALPLYFHFGYIPDPYTIFKNVFRLEAGMIMEIPLPFNSFNFKKEKYWSPDSYFINPNEKTQEYSDEKIINDLEKILKESFQYRMVADVDVGVFLSGGIDSSLIAAILQKSSSKKIKTFTIGFQDEKYNEAPVARKIAEFLGTEHHEYYLSSDDLHEAFEQYAEIFDEPFGDSSGLPTYLLAKKAREEVKVALSGDGGDELFFGYDKYQAIGKIINSPVFVNNFGRKAIDALGPGAVSKIYNIFSKILPLPKYSNLREKLSKLSNLLKGKNFSEMFDLASSYWQNEEIYNLLGNSGRTNIFHQNYDLDFKEQMQIWDIKNYLSGDILVKTDRATMAQGLEAREPYLDYHILEYFSKIPNNLRHKKNNSKYWLKQVLYKYLPEKLVGHQKFGFQAPVSEIFKNSWKELSEKYLNQEFVKKQGLFNYGFIQKLKEEQEKGHYLNPDKLWILVAFQMWYKRWMN